MKKIGLAIALLACLAVTVRSQEQTPELLFRAAQCLVIRNFLPSSKATTLILGYLLDEKSYPGDKVIYLVSYAAPTRSNGLVFAIFLTEHDGHQEFNIQNNASFVLSKTEFHGVSFIDPPLGGTWTQEHLASAIKRIEKQRRFTISVKHLSVGPPQFFARRTLILSRKKVKDSARFFRPSGANARSLKAAPPVLDCGETDACPRQIHCA